MASTPAENPPIAIQVFRLVRRNAISVGFPLVAGYLIYKDYSRTQAYKAQKILKRQASEAIGTDIKTGLRDKYFWVAWKAYGLSESSGMTLAKYAPMFWDKTGKYLFIWLTISLPFAHKANRLNAEYLAGCRNKTALHGGKILPPGEVLWK